jgi:hypothetical protein
MVRRQPVGSEVFNDVPGKQLDIVKVTFNIIIIARPDGETEPQRMDILAIV